MAGPNAALLHIGGTAMAAAVTHVQLHSDTPDASGSNECACAREAITLSDTAGVITGGPADFTGGAASGPVRYVGYWSAASGGVFYGADPISGDQAFNAAGEYTLDSVTITGSGS